MSGFQLAERSTFIRKDLLGKDPFLSRKKIKTTTLKGIPLRSLKKKKLFIFLKGYYFFERESVAEGQREPGRQIPSSLYTISAESDVGL